MRELPTSLTIMLSSTITNRNQEQARKYFRILVLVYQVVANFKQRPLAENTLWFAGNVDLQHSVAEFLHTVGKLDSTNCTNCGRAEALPKLLSLCLQACSNGNVYFDHCLTVVCRVFQEWLDQKDYCSTRHFGQPDIPESDAETSDSEEDTSDTEDDESNMQSDLNAEDPASVNRLKRKPHLSDDASPKRFKTGQQDPGYQRVHTECVQCKSRTQVMTGNEARGIRNTRAGQACVDNEQGQGNVLACTKCGQEVP